MALKDWQSILIRLEPWGSDPHKSSLGRGRWDRNRTCNLRFWRPNPACRVVSDAIATCRPAPVSLSSCAAPMSPGVGVHWGTYWGSLCFRGRYCACSESPIRGRNHVTRARSDGCSSPSQCAQCVLWNHELSDATVSNRPMVFRSVRFVCWRFCWQTFHSRSRFACLTRHVR
jgi:hypothetical protein